MPKVKGASLVMWTRYSVTNYQAGLARIERERGFDGPVPMSRREKLIEEMRSSPGSIRFAAVESLFRYEGFVPFNSRSSHHTYHRDDGRVLTIVRPHGRRKTCHPEDIRRLLEALGR